MLSVFGIAKHRFSFGCIRAVQKDVEIMPGDGGQVEVASKNQLSEAEFTSFLCSKLNVTEASLTRDLLDEFLRSNPAEHAELGAENLRRLKISLANRGRKAWNKGRQHSEETKARIREKTRQAMFRSDVRQRWQSKWKPKNHTNATKNKLRKIMVQKASAKIADLEKWLEQEMGIDHETYKNLGSRFKKAYIRIYNVKQRMKVTTTQEEMDALAQDLHKANSRILDLHAAEAEKQQRKEARRLQRIEDKRLARLHPRNLTGTPRKRRATANKTKKTSVSRPRVRRKRQSRKPAKMTTRGPETSKLRKMELYGKTLEVYCKTNEQFQWIDSYFSAIARDLEDHEISSATKALERARTYLGDARLKVEVLKTALEESNTVSPT